MNLTHQKFAAIFLISALVVICLVAEIDAQDKKDLPVLASENLDKKYVDWSFLKQNVEVSSFYRSYFKNGVPSLVKGDFDGNGLEDMAALVAYPNTIYSEKSISHLYDLVVLLNKKNNYQLVIIESKIPENDIVYLSLIKKGTSIAEFDSAKTFLLKNDSFSFSFFEKAGSVYYFMNGKFHTVTTSD